MIRRGAATLVASLVVLGLAGCGGGDPTPVPETGAPSSSQTMTEATTDSSEAPPDNELEAGPAAENSVGTTPTTLATSELTPSLVGAADVVAPSPPSRVVVPSVGIDASLGRLGLDGEEVAAPERFDEAGWYTGSVEPGQIGPAVLAGHVDSTDGPAIFYRLGEVQPGDEIVVERADGSALTFEVTSVERTAKEGLPAEMIHGPVALPELRVITCGGDFDRSTGHYRDNVVVEAVLR